MENTTKLSKVRITISLIFITYIAIVFFLTLHQFKQTLDLNLDQYFLGMRFDHIVHFIMFLPYSILTWVTLNYAGRKIVTEGTKKIKNIFVILISGIAFGTITEILQKLITTSRQYDPSDIRADTISILVGIVIAILLDKWFLKKMRRTIKN